MKMQLRLASGLILVAVCGAEVYWGNKNTKSVEYYQSKPEEAFDVWKRCGVGIPNFPFIASNCNNATRALRILNEAKTG